MLRTNPPGGSPYFGVQEHFFQSCMADRLAKVRVDEGWYLEAYPDVREAISSGTVPDARTHFAIVCAAKGSPALLPRAYRAATLSADLDAQARAFVRDTTRNVIDPAEAKLQLSEVFEWSRKEFEREAGSLGAYVSRFTPHAVGDWLRTFAKSPEFLPFDWALNQAR